MFVFFFQAEDGIRDRNVTGVQTCALPICPYFVEGEPEGQQYHLIGGHFTGSMTSHSLESIAFHGGLTVHLDRSEERRVGKECRCRGARDDAERQRMKETTGGSIMAR